MERKLGSGFMAALDSLMVDAAALAESARRLHEDAIAALVPEPAESLPVCTECGQILTQDEHAAGGRCYACGRVDRAQAKEYQEYF